MAHRQFARQVFSEYWVPGFHGFLLDLLVDLIEQAADPAQSEIAETAGQGKQLDERRFVQLQTKVSSPARCSVQVARSPISAASRKHSPVVISKVVSVPGRVMC